MFFCSLTTLFSSTFEARNVVSEASSVDREQKSLVSSPQGFVIAHKRLGRRTSMVRHLTAMHR